MNSMNSVPASALEHSVPIRNARGEHEEHAEPLAGNGKVPFLTPGVWVLLALAAAGLTVLAVRLIWGIGAVTNLNNQYPWGLWIAVDVACGVVLAAERFHHRLPGPHLPQAPLPRHRAPGPVDGHDRLHLRGSGRGG